MSRRATLTIHIWSYKLIYLICLQQSASFITLNWHLVSLFNGPNRTLDGWLTLKGCRKLTLYTRPRKSMTPQVSCSDFCSSMAYTMTPCLIPSWKNSNKRFANGTASKYLYMTRWSLRITLWLCHYGTYWHWWLPTLVAYINYNKYWWPSCGAKKDTWPAISARNDYLLFQNILATLG